jgi:predicted Fe-Mo cluster-binding NifX family protein
MKIAIATDNYTRVAGHAGKARHWLLYLLHGHTPQQLLPAPTLIKLAPEQVMHHFKDDAPHPLDGVDLVVADSAGEGFIRHMRERGADVLLTGEDDPATALTQILAGEALPDPRFDVTTTLCKLRDLFSRH